MRWRRIAAETPDRKSGCAPCCTGVASDSARTTQACQETQISFLRVPALPFLLMEIFGTADFS